MNQKILAFIYNAKTKKWLALQNKNNPGHEGNFWFTVTGNLENEENYENAAKREVREETALIVKEIKDLCWGSYYLWNGRENEEHYFLAIVKEENIKLNEEHANYEWLLFDDYIERIDWKGEKTELRAVLQRAIENGKSAWERMDNFISKEPKVYLKHNGEAGDLIWFKKGDFSGIKPVRQVSTVCFNDSGEILIVKPDEEWEIPGGKPESEETSEDTLRREVDEEGDVNIEKIIPIGYNRVEMYDENGRRKEISYQLRYFSIVSKVKPQTIDPAHGRIPERKFVKPDEFLKYCNWGRTGKAMIDAAVEVWNHHRKGLL